MKQRFNPVFPVGYYFTIKTFFKKIWVRRDQSVYLVGEPSKGLCFIAKDSVFLTTSDHARFEELHETDFFLERVPPYVHCQKQKCLCDGRLLSLFA